MLKYFSTKDSAKCCGCSACEQICPKKAIELKSDEEGFLYPVLNEELCINCGLCKKVCQYDEEIEKNEPKEVYAANNNDLTILKKSSSGGLFRAFADYITENKGVVSGCIFDENFKAIHVVSDEEGIIAKMQGSKYVQSELGNTFSQIKSCLENGRSVLFSGTPCQVAGLNSFLQKPYENLYTIDLICHGVPSPLLLEEYIKKTQADKGTVTDLKFRNKEKNGWCSQGTVTYKNGNKETTVSTTPFKDSYYNLYYMQNCVSRLSCYACQYATTNRVADITIGDYWNAGDVFSDNKIKNGMSAMLVNTSKGTELLEKVKDNLNIENAELNHIVKANGNLQRANKKPVERDNIYKDLKSRGYDYVIRTYCKFTYLVPFIKKHTPKFLKRVLKSVLH